MADVAEVAKKALEDPDYAQQVIEGDDHPEVKEAILADLEEGAGEVEGFAFSRAALQPGTVRQYTQLDTAGGQNLSRLAGVAMGW